MPMSDPTSSEPAPRATDPRLAPESNVRFWDGNRACAEGAIMAGLGFYGGYPITPSTEIAEFLSWRLPQEGGVFIQMEDEIASLAACIGASYGGLKAMTATSGPGFSLCQENLGLACMTETPLVLVNVQRMGPSTGQPTRPSQGDLMQAVWGTHGDHPIIVLSPSSVAEMLSLTVRAFNLSERFRTPVVLLADEMVAHMREKVELPPPGTLDVWNRPRPLNPPEDYVAYAETPDQVPPMATFGEGGYRYHVTGLFHDQDGFPTDSPPVIDAWMHRVFRKIEQNLDLICSWELLVDGEVYDSSNAQAGLEAVPRCDLLLVSYGCSARAAVAVPRERARTAVLRLKTVWPLHERFMGDLLGRVPNVLVVEMNRGQMTREIERLAAGRSRVRGVLRYDGEMITPAHVLAAARELS